MALTINSNVYALNAQRSLGTTQSQLGQSLERLSSGLRINRAADDASGLAISEKLRGQISGLKRASMNAQDGISMLQTAEGGLSEISSMLQRMRELAVQASNGIYTTEDRAEIQKEVDQLKDEIDRISTSTEFNTRKLLNGDATALWSADTDKISALIRGNVEQGNYEIQLASTPGQNQVMTTDIMTLREGAIGSEIMTVTGAVSANDTNVSFAKDPVTLNPTGTAYYTVNIGDGTATAAGTVTGSATVAGVYAQDGSSFAAVVSSAGSANTMGGYVEFEFLEDFTYATAASTVDIRYRFIDAKTGTMSDWVTETENVAGVTAVFTMSFTDSAGSTGTIGFQAQPGSVIQSGDKMLFNFTGDVTYVTAITTSIGINGGGSIQISDGPNSTTGPTLVYTASDSLTVLDNGDTTVDYNDATVYMAEIDGSTGNVDLGHLTFSFREQNYANSAVTTTSGLTQAGDFALKINGGGEAASSSTKLKDIARFIDADGVNVLDNKQEITIFGNGRQATIFIEGEDTITELEQKLTDAIVNQLDMGGDNSELNNHLVDYVTSPVQNTTASVKGTFVIQTAQTGEQGELAFIADQGVIDALSLSTVQEATANTTEVTIRDADTGDLIGTDETGDDRVYGLIDGVEVVLDSRAGIDSEWNATSNEVNFFQDPNAATKRYYLHVVDNATELQIGANEGQNINVSIPQLDVKGLGVENVTMVSQEFAQRAIPDIDEALQQLVSVRASIGAQVSRLEHSIVNLDTARENMMASESRIRDLDIASETTEFTSAQILSQSGISMLAQANQVPQMALQLLQF